MSRPSDLPPCAAHTVPAGSFVATHMDDRRVVCLKVERLAKDHINHFLVPVDPVAETLALVYIDPDTEVTPVPGLSFAFEDGPEGATPAVGEAFSCAAGTFLKVMDDLQTQRLYAYVDLASGLVRLRMERQASRVVGWSVARG
jgi:hypothetical protein